MTHKDSTARADARKDDRLARRGEHDGPSLPILPTRTEQRSSGTPGEPALLRPGHEVLLVRMSATEALVHSTRRLKPGVRTELLQISNPEWCATRGVIDMCRVSSLAPLCYEGRIVFDAAAADTPDAHQSALATSNESPFPRTDIRPDFP